MVRIVIVEDHFIVREGLKAIIGAESDMIVVGESGNGLEALPMVRKLHPDVLLLDLSLPGKSGLEILSQIVSESLKCRVIILSIYPENQYALRLLRSGASCYLMKDSVSDRLVDTIRQVARGKRIISQEVSELMLNDIVNESGKEAHHRLSDREYQTFLMLADGVSVADIASQLHLSVKTVGTYRSRVLEKLNLKNIVDITHYAISHGLIVNHCVDDQSVDCVFQRPHQVDWLLASPL